MFNYIKFNLFLRSSFIEADMAYGDTTGIEPRNLEQKKGNPDLSHLSLEDREKVEALRKESENIKGSLKFLNQYITGLNAGLDKISKTENPNDKTFQQFKTRIDARLFTLGLEYQVFSGKQTDVKAQLDKINGIQRDIRTEIESFENKSGVDIDVKTGEVKKMSLDKDKLKTIDNKEFLSVPASERLQYITKENIDADRVSSGEVKDLEFTFTFDGQFNKELYLKTTAGQVLPKEVGSVIVNGKEFNRINNSALGEFYDVSNNRLEIHENTKLEVTKTRNPEELTKIENGLSEALKGKDKPLDKMIAEVAYNKGVNEKLLTSIAKEHLDIAGLDLWDYDEQDKVELQKLLENEDYIKRELEIYATDISRYLSGGKNLGKDNYSIEMLAGIFRERNPAGWENKLVEYGFSKEQVAEYNKNTYRVESGGLGSLSASEESGNRGPEAINLQDTKGPAYGTYQLCQGSLLEFAKNNGISGTPGTTEFTSNWTAKINELGKGNFQKLEHEFIKKTHFDVQMNKISGAGIDISKAGLPLQNVIWSTAVQHGPNTQLIINSINELGIKDLSSLENQEKVINKIYENRTNAYPEGKDRYKRELDKALSSLKSSLPGEINLGNFLPSPVEIDEKGTTLCSRTAWKNLQNIGIDAPRGSSAKASLEMYDQSKITKTFDPNAKVADLFMDASPKNKEHGHRAVAVNNGGNWYVLDPYLPIGGKPATTQPIPLQEYMNHIESRGRKFWGAVMYS